MPRPAVPYAHHLFHRHFAEILGHQQVDQVVDVRQPLAVEHFDRYWPVEALGPNEFPRRGHLVGSRVQTMHQVAVARAQGRGEVAVPAVEMDDQSAIDARFLQNLCCLAQHRAMEAQQDNR